MSENISMMASSKDVNELVPQKSMSLSIKYVYQKSISNKHHLSNPSKKQSTQNDQIIKDGLKLMSYQRSALVKKTKADTMIENKELEVMLSSNKKSSKNHTGTFTMQRSRSRNESSTQGTNRRPSKASNEIL